MCQFDIAGCLSVHLLSRVESQVPVVLYRDVNVQLLGGNSLSLEVFRILKIYFSPFSCEHCGTNHSLKLNVFPITNC